MNFITLNSYVYNRSDDVLWNFELVNTTRTFKDSMSSSRFTEINVLGDSIVCGKSGNNEQSSVHIACENNLCLFDKSWSMLQYCYNIQVRYSFSYY